MDESTVKSEFQKWFKKTYPEAIFGEPDHFDHTERDLLDCWKAAITMIVNWRNCECDEGWKPTPEMEIERLAATGGSFIPPSLQKALREQKQQKDDH